MPKPFLIPKPESVLITSQPQLENVLKQSKNGHQLVMVKRTRVKGFCVECIKQNKDPHYKKHLTKIITHCPKCPGKIHSIN